MTLDRDSYAKTLAGELYGLAAERILDVAYRNLLNDAACMIRDQLDELQELRVGRTMKLTEYQVMDLSAKIVDSADTVLLRKYGDCPCCGYGGVWPIGRDQSIELVSEMLRRAVSHEAAH